MKPEASPNERFLSRWSRLKREQAVAPAAGAAGTALPAVPGVSATGPAAAAPAPAASTQEVPPLPAIESLTIDSDFAPFFQPKVPAALRNAAVKKLFADPHFNIMDGLDTYIDDYSKPDPLPEGWLEQLAHARDIIDHPSNRKTVEETAAALGDTSVETTYPVVTPQSSPPGGHVPGHEEAMTETRGSRDPALEAVVQADLLDPQTHQPTASPHPVAGPPALDAKNA